MKIHILIIFMSALSFHKMSAEESLEVDAYKRDSVTYTKVAKKLKLDEHDAFGLIKKASKLDKDLNLYYLSSSPWIIGKKYFFPYKASLLSGRNNRFRELGVYVDGYSGRVEKVTRENRFVRVIND